MTLCSLASHLFGSRPGPCPALRFDGPESQCGLITHTTGELRAAASLAIRSGEGCDARFNGEPINHSYHAECARADSARAPEIAAAFRTWGF